MSTPTKRRKQAAKLTEIAPTAPPTEAQPKWASETPNFDYSLEIYFDGVSDDSMHIDLTRAEFVALKQRLAELRGIPFDAERAA